MNVEMLPSTKAGTDITLVVEQHTDCRVALKRQHEFPDFDFVLLDDLDHEYLGRIRPLMVVASLFGVAHDATDIAQKLSDTKSPRF